MKQQLMFGPMAPFRKLLAALAPPPIVPRLIEQRCNRLNQRPPYAVSDAMRAVHQTQFVADLHADSLLWARDLLQRHAYGHVDLPRLVAGNVALQVFGVVTKVPKGQNFEANDADTDRITSLAMVQGWPVCTWHSLLERALYQAEKLQDLVARSAGRLCLVRSTADLKHVVSRRQGDAGLVGALLGLEGVHALEGDLDNVEVLHAAGFRMMGLAHFFDNQAGGSAHGRHQGGLTAFGRQLVARLERHHMIVDLAHASAQVMDDVLELTHRPVVVSHTGVKGTCSNQRNLSDRQLRGIAKTGGVVGIAMFPEAVGGTSIDDTARAMRYASDVIGVEHVALGSDFDGAVTTPIDASGMALLTAALVKSGFGAPDIEKILGTNVLRVLFATLPDA